MLILLNGSSVDLGYWAIAALKILKTIQIQKQW